ncbi:ribonucleases P/MRP protein subunit POP1, putative [Plasmodium relictum]|uniref:Ribonucleases P/MRP protein subunit POP1, putative n=1 Tax=Plasmodium relictum TaxID=85471 RepID=A0A1J1H4R4_PLARL|nr:ribonucleases P/MRP protein subunit POP1, putative [Plasmodium relictum]CRG98427.1 ribonucleases P/MRP protein subunit POP1, putative [Plasmodium relictum]
MFVDFNKDKGKKNISNKSNDDKKNYDEKQYNKIDNTEEENDTTKFTSIQNEKEKNYINFISKNNNNEKKTVKVIDKKNDKKKKNDEKTYKSIYEIRNNSDVNFFNTESVPWISSFFNLKDEDLLIFGRELRKRNIFKRCFQRIHKNRRRRCMSFNPYRVPLACKKATLEEMLISEPKIKKKKKKKKNVPFGYFYRKFIMRSKKKNWLETHMYHSKRFHMMSIFGYKLAIKNCSKISRRIFRFSKRKSLIHDMSYIEIIQLSGDENTIIDVLKKCTNIEQANMLKKKYLLGILLGKIFIYKYENNDIDEKEKKDNMSNHSDLNKNNNDNFFNSKNPLICPAYFLWRSTLKPYVHLKKEKRKNNNIDNDANKENKNKLNNNKDCSEKKKEELEDKIRDIWLFVHPLCLKETMKNFQKINSSIHVKHIKNICMYELIGPRSFELLINILKIKNKYPKKMKRYIYHYNYEKITLPYDYVIPLYAILPKCVGPFLLNYKINENEVQQIDKKESYNINSLSKENKDINIIKNNKKNVDNIIENAFDYIQEKNENRVLKKNEFSQYDNNILMNEKIKQKVIKNIKVNKYEHIRSNKKKKVKTTILKMLKNNKYIESYDILKEKRKSLCELLGNAHNFSSFHSSNILSNNCNNYNKTIVSRSNINDNSNLLSSTTDNKEVVTHGISNKNEEKENITKISNDLNFYFKDKKESTHTFENNEFLKYMKKKLSKKLNLTYDKDSIQNYINECLNNDGTKDENCLILKKKETSDVYKELNKIKENLKQNSKKYIKIPILIVNQTNNNNHRYFIICPSKKKSSILFHLLIRNGSIAIGLKEREKIMKCYDFICYPQDFPDSYGGILYNKLRESISKKKYLKKPLSKRINYYCLGINDPFNYSWFCVYPYKNDIKIIRTTDCYNQFLIQTFIQRFLYISLKKIYHINTFEEFYNFLEHFKSKFHIFSSYFITVYVSAYKKSIPKRLSHVCALTLKQTIKFFIKQIDTKKILEWVEHKRIINKNNKDKIEKLKEPVIYKYKNKVIKKNKCERKEKAQMERINLQKSSTDNGKPVDDIILSSKKIIGYVSSGGHVLSKGYGYGIAHISFYFFLENLLNHIFALKLLVSDEIKIKEKGKNFPFIGLIRNVNSAYYHHVWISLVTEDKYLPF